MTELARLERRDGCYRRTLSVDVEDGEALLFETEEPLFGAPGACRPLVLDADEAEWAGQSLLRAAALLRQCDARQPALPLLEAA